MNPEILTTQLSFLESAERLREHIEAKTAELFTGRTVEWAEGPSHQRLTFRSVVQRAQWDGFRVIFTVQVPGRVPLPTLIYAERCTLIAPKGVER